MSKGTVNKVILLGRLGSNPEMRYTPSGMAVASLSLATNDGYKDKQSGQFIETTEWHRVSVFGKQADFISQYAQKGGLIYLEGKIRTNKWQDQSGQTKYSTEVVATEVQLVGGRGDQQASGGPQGQPMAQPSSRPSTQQYNNQSQQPPQNPDMNQLNDFDDDDIPF